METITINRNNLTPDSTWEQLYKVRAIIENDNKEFIITRQGGKYIFPGGGVKPGESSVDAIIREINEETGIMLSPEILEERLKLDTYYPSAYNYQTGTYRPRHTVTIFFYVKCSGEIKSDKMSLTANEIDGNFKVAFVSLEKLLEIVYADHSAIPNGAIFDEENRMAVSMILNERIISDPSARKI